MQDNGKQASKCMIISNRLNQMNFQILIFLES
jgi:hypothetical protein